MTEFRVKMRTRDGQLVQNRISDKDFWFNRFYSGRFSFNEAFAKISLEQDCREKGCYLISYTVDPETGIDAIVSWSAPR